MKGKREIVAGALLLGIVLANLSMVSAYGKVCHTGQKGSMLLYPNVELRWNAAGELVQETFVSLSNDYPTDVNILWYFLNGDPPLAADPPERAHLGHNWIYNSLSLTPGQPIFWAVSTGKVGGIETFSPFTSLDPGSPVGRPANDGSGDRIMRGTVIAWAINEYGEEIRWNHLFGGATIINYAARTAWQYNAQAFKVESTVQHGEVTGTPKILGLDGVEFNACPDTLALDFFATDSLVFSNTPWNVSVDTGLSLFSPISDLRTGEHRPVTSTWAVTDVWNMNEMLFSGTGRCLTFWDSLYFSQYSWPNSFVLANLGTDKGHAAIYGLEDLDCSEDSVDSPLVGTAVSILEYDGTEISFSGTAIPGTRIEENAIIEYSYSTPPPVKRIPGDYAEPEKVDTEVNDGLFESQLTDDGTSYWSIGNPGSLLVVPNIELRWDAAGNLIQDTFVEIANKGLGVVTIEILLINGDPPLGEEGGERAHPGWNHVSDFLHMTPLQPTYWIASRGLPTGGLSLETLDPDEPSGRPATDGSGERVLRGFAYIWAVDEQGHEISWNQLSGKVTVVNYPDTSSWAYLPYSFPVNTSNHINGYRTGTPGILDLDGQEYGYCPDYLVYNFYAPGNYGLNGSTGSVSSDTELTLLPLICNVKNLLVEPVVTKAKVDIWNLWEVRFSNTERCVTNSDRTLLSDFGPVNHFPLSQLQTDAGRSAIEGMESPMTCGEECIDAPLVGVSMHLLQFDGSEYARAGAALPGRGSQVGQLIVDEDCNGNGIMDNMDIHLGNSFDCVGNGIPDECELIGDFDQDQDIDLDDHARFVECFAGPGAAPAPIPPVESSDCLEAFDRDCDADVDLADFAIFQAVFGSAPD